MKRFILFSGFVLSLAFVAAPSPARADVTVTLGLGYPYYAGYPFFYGAPSTFPSFPYYVYMPYYTPPDFTHQTIVYPPPEITISTAPMVPPNPCRKVQTSINGTAVFGRVCPQPDGSWRFSQ